MAKKEKLTVTQDNIGEVMSDLMRVLGKRSHQKSPRTKKFYQDMVNSRKDRKKKRG